MELLLRLPEDITPGGNVLIRWWWHLSKGGESLPLRNLSLEERRDAQECGLASVLCALGLTGDLPFSVLNYEAPFGVGVLCGLSQSSRGVSPA